MNLLPPLPSACAHCLQRIKQSVQETAVISFPALAQSRGLESGTHKGTTPSTELERTPILYLPSDLDLENLLRERKLTDWLSSTRYDKLRFIVHCIYWFSLLNKSNDTDSEEYPYVQLKFSYLKRLLGTSYARSALDVLLSLNVIETDGRYAIGSKSIGYRLTPAFRGKIRGEKVKSRSLCARIIREEKLRRLTKSLAAAIEPSSKLPPVYEWIESNVSRLSYPDLPEGFLAEFTGRAYNQRLLCIEAVQRQESFFTVDKKVGRCFSIVTSTPSELRAKLLLDGEPTSEVDIASAQPLLAATLYPHDCPEKERYLSCIGSDFYATLNQWAGNPYGSRKEAKTACYEQIFFGGVYPDAPLWKIFREAFPWLAQHIVTVKKGHKGPPRYRTVDGKRVLKRGNPAFALLLQKKEADIVIHTAGEALRQETIPFVTIHDSLLCRQRDEGRVEAALGHAIQEKTGLPSKLAVKAA
jgi:hypothetical protein